jgi:hypothetical protein
MSSIVIAGDTSGSVTLSAPAVAGTVTVTLPAASGTMLTTATAGVPVNGPAFSAWQSSAQTLTSNVLTKILYQSELWDTNSNYDTSTSRFTPTVAGYYQINAAVCTGASSSQQLLAIYKNGALYQRNDIPSININQISSIVSLNGSTDYIEIYASFGTGQITSANVNLNWFNGAMVRGA